MIQYKVSGSIVKYKSADDIDIHSWTQIFADDNPLIARQKAIKFYNDYLLVIKEDGENIEAKITKGGDSSDDIGLGVGVYLEIKDPFEKLWDKVNIPNPPIYGLGTDLEDMIKELVSNGDLESEDDFEYCEDDFQWIITGIGDGIFATAPLFIHGLENEIAIYEYFNYDKNGLEITVPCFDHNKKKIIEHKILEIPFDWNRYNQLCLTDTSIIKQEKLNREAEKYLELIKKGEGKQVEFIATLCFDIREQQKNEHIKLSIAKTLAAFLNTDGGLLFIGINDNGDICGLENDYQTFESENKQDSFRRKLNNIIRDFIGKECHQYIDAKFYSHNDKEFMVVTVNKSSFPVTLTNKSEKEFYIRGIADTEKLDIAETIKWVLDRFKNGKQ